MPQVTHTLSTEEHGLHTPRGSTTHRFQKAVLSSGLFALLLLALFAILNGPLCLRCFVMYILALGAPLASATHEELARPASLSGPRRILAPNRLAGGRGVLTPAIRLPFLHFLWGVAHGGSVPVLGRDELQQGRRHLKRLRLFCGRAVLNRVCCPLRSTMLTFGRTWLLILLAAASPALWGRTSRRCLWLRHHRHGKRHWWHWHAHGHHRIRCNTHLLTLTCSHEHRVRVLLRGELHEFTNEGKVTGEQCWIPESPVSSSSAALRWLPTPDQSMLGIVPAPVLSRPPHTHREHCACVYACSSSYTPYVTTNFSTSE